MTQVATVRWVILAAVGVASRADPNLVDALVLRGMAFAHLQRPQDAVQQFSRALTLAPDRATLYLYRGAALEELGDAPRAAADFSEAERRADGDHRILSATRVQLARLTDLSG